MPLVAVQVRIVYVCGSTQPLHSALGGPSYSHVLYVAKASTYYLKTRHYYTLFQVTLIVWGGFGVPLLASASCITTAYSNTGIVCNYLSLSVTKLGWSSPGTYSCGVVLCTPNAGHALVTFGRPPAGW